MPTYLFQARQVPPVAEGQPPPVMRFMLYLPGNPGQFSHAEVLGYVRQYNLGTVGLTYSLKELTARDRPVVVSEAQYAQFAGAPLRGAHPSTVPQSNRGLNRQDGPIDSAGFQTLGDGAMGSVGLDRVYGDTDDGTYTDIYLDPRQGAIEVPRP